MEHILDEKSRCETTNDTERNNFSCELDEKFTYNVETNVQTCGRRNGTPRILL